MPTYYDPVTGKPIGQSPEEPTYYNPVTGEPIQKASPLPASTPPSMTPDQASNVFKAGVHSKMLGITPSTAYDQRDTIDRELRTRGGDYDGELDPSIVNDIKVGIQGSIFGLKANKKLPDEIRNPGLIDKAVQGITGLIADSPFMLAGGLAGGAAGSEVPVVGNAVGAGAGAFALPAALREVLVQGIQKGDVKDFPDLLRRAGAVTWAATKGAITGAATEAAGGLPVGSFLAKSGLASTAVKGLYQATALTTTADLLEGKLPTANDFAANSALIIPLNLITHGMPMRGRESKQALMDVYAKDGKTPAESADTLAAQPPVKFDMPEGLRPAIQTGEGHIEGETTETHDDLAERGLAKKPVTMAELEAKPERADDVLETPAVHDQDVIDRAWQIKKESIEAEGISEEDKGKSIEEQLQEQQELAAEKRAAGEDPGEPRPPKEPHTIDDLYDRASMKSGRGFSTPDGKFLSRTEARKWMKDKEPDVHEMWLNEAEGDKQAELHAEDYGIARMRAQARNVAEGDAVMAKVSPENAKRLAAAREGLNKIKAGSESTGYGKEVLRTLFAGQRDARIAETTQLRDSIKKMIPDYRDQEALSILRDYKDRPEKLAADLEEIRNGDSERLKGIIPSIERAMNPSPELLKADQAMTGYYTKALSEANELQMFTSKIDPANYSPHLLTRILDGEEPSSGRGGPMSSSTPFGKERKYPTVIDAMKGGTIDARTLNAVDALSIYGDRHATVVATKLLSTELRNTELGKYGTRDDHPDGWVKLAPGNEALSNGAESLYVPKVVADAMKPLFEQGLSQTAFAPLLKSQGYVKAMELGLSLFHVKAINITAFNNMALTDFTKALVTDTKSPEFAAAERGWAADGLTTSKTQTPYEAYKGLEKSSIKPEATNAFKRGFQALKDSAAISAVDAALKKTTEYTFDVVQRKFKVQDASLKEARWLAKNPEATNEEHFAARRSIAKEVNAAYGGLNWDVLGTGKTVRDVSRLLLLAPDWTFSNVLNAKYAFEGGPAGSAARMFWAKSFATGIAMTAATSIAIGGKYNSDAKHFDQVYLGTDKDGKEMYSSWFFAGAPKDMMTLARRTASDGPLAGPAEFVVSKAAAYLGVAVGLYANKQGNGAPIFKKSDSFGEKFVETGIFTAKRVTPITGVSVVETVKNAMSDPDHQWSYRDLLELAADAIGSPTRHEGSASGGSSGGSSPATRFNSTKGKSRFSIKGKR